MKSYFGVCLILFIFMNNISYGQSYECDNNFEECGTPNQSGGGGGGGSILIANTDLGDSYQHADDYDDDGIEDPSDNCIRYSNPQQYDRDGDGRGDMCDNCLYDWNPDQENIDGDDLGDVCDNDIDNDQILNSADDCPYHWGNSSCFNDYSINQTETFTIKDDQPLLVNKTNNETINNITNDESCNQINIKTNFIYSLFFLFIIPLIKRANKV